MRTDLADLKNIIVSILAFSILSFQWSELLVFVSFKINQEYIAKNLCVEKDIEDSECRGCCQLKKKVNEQQEQKQELPQTQEQKNNINFCHHYSSILISSNQAGSSLLIYQYNNYNFQKYYSIFRPPQIAIK